MNRRPKNGGKHGESRCRGFTLIETILTIVVVGIIAGVSAKVLLAGLDTYSFITSRKDATQNARVAMNRMVSEITLLRSSDITAIFNEYLGFIDREGVGTSFQRRTTLEGQLTIARGYDYLAGPLGFIDFDYLRAGGSETSSISEVRKISVELSMESSGGYGAMTLRTEVFPRSFMYDDFR